MDHPKSGLPDFGRFKCASRVNPTCVVKPAGDENIEWRAIAVVVELSCPGLTRASIFLSQKSL
jgi:hypothetical protein